MEEYVEIDYGGHGGRCCLLWHMLQKFNIRNPGGFKCGKKIFCNTARSSQLTGRTEELLCDPLAAVEVSDAVLGVGPPPVVIVGTLKVLGGGGGGEQGQEDHAEDRLHLRLRFVLEEALGQFDQV